MRAQEGADPHPVLFAVGNVARPVLPLEDRRTQTCQACHEPHKLTANRPAQPGPDPQLRAWGNVKFRNDKVAFAGEAAICYMCHQSRTDARVNSTDWNSRRAPHDSTAAEMLSATNGLEIAGWNYTSSPHADPKRFVVAGKSEARQCLTCHNDVAPSKGQTGYQTLGSHSFKMAQGDGTSTVNDGTFGAGTTTAGTRQFVLSAAPGIQTFLRKIFTGDILVLTGARGDYDGNGSAEFVQLEIAGLRAAVKAEVEAQISTIVGSPVTLTPGSGKMKYTITAGAVVRVFPGPGVSTSDNPDILYNTLTDPQKAQWDALYAAGYDWAFVGNDLSEGVHNTGYAVNLLQSTYKAMTGTTIGTPFVPF
jgi:cytochrome c2